MRTTCLRKCLLEGIYWFNVRFLSGNKGALLLPHTITKVWNTAS
uniref:Uncharacterized protein n=1 Tax=Arundo donax TaxID=35708 RepID=A0A0A9GB93_ARUDO